MFKVKEIISPCPFCDRWSVDGGVVLQKYWLSDYYAVHCTCCGATGSRSSNPETAIRDWNRGYAQKVTMKNLKKSSDKVYCESCVHYFGEGKLMGWPTLDNRPPKCHAKYTRSVGKTVDTWLCKRVEVIDEGEKRNPAEVNKNNDCPDYKLHPALGPIKPVPE